MNARTSGAWSPTIYVNSPRKRSWRIIPIFLPNEKNIFSDNDARSVTFVPDRTTRCAKPLRIIAVLSEGSIWIGRPNTSPFNNDAYGSWNELSIPMSAWESKKFIMN